MSNCAHHMRTAIGDVTNALYNKLKQPLYAPGNTSKRAYPWAVFFIFATLIGLAVVLAVAYVYPCGQEISIGNFDPTVSSRLLHMSIFAAALTFLCFSNALENTALNEGGCWAIGWKIL